ncbi:mitochondrial protein from FMP27-domain-containing protein [Ilyonectria robusta]|uniref:mitochondrial protein from FMP27-domain-containing protein n=1 Tax=Ilyonectria robusta TaxID=1079257 RepID=UPI001E8CA1AF|nr:mitochondrial protein from FMP27-domain-containing protein [Ilyonectria robusta]KAH8669952.1 mitochondrial protein from FMP27-domain-containing protein [Ilyonectria robusta]
MALLNPTFVFGLIVLLYLSSFVLLAVLRILTGISIQRIGYFSLRRLAYTPRDGCRIEIRGLGLNVHRPTFAQPTWVSLVLSELIVTLDIRELEGNKPAESDGESSDTDTDKNKTGDAKSNPIPRSRSSRQGAHTIIRSETWKKLTNVKEKIKRLHKNINWLRLIDVVATNSIINIVDVGNIQVGSFTVSVDTRPKMVDRARFFVQGKHSPSKDRQAEWTMTVRSVLFTADGNESMELLDHLFLNIHGFLYKSREGLRDAAVSLKLGRLHIPLDDMQTCLTKLKQCRKDPKSTGVDEPIDIFLGKVVQEVDEPGSTNADLMRTVSDSKEFFSSILRGIKEVQLAVSFLGLTSKVQPVKAGANPILLNAAMKEVGIDLHRLDPKSPAHRMYFPPEAIAHEALGAALSISVGLDDGNGQSDRLIYIPMATTTVKTTLLSKTVEVLQGGKAEERNANIMFANSVVTSPSVDLDPRHIPLLLALMKSKPKAQKAQTNNRHLISRLLPKANIKFSMHEPVVRIKLKPLQKTEDPDDFDLIISSISSISIDMESSHSIIEDLHYSLDGAVRLQSHDLYYQTNTGDRFNLITTESFDMKVHLGARPDVYVEMTGNIQSAAISMVRPEITDGLRQIVRELRFDVEPEKGPAVKASRGHNFLRSAPSWLLRYQMDITDFSVEIAGIDEDISDDTRGIFLHWDHASAEYRAHRFDGLQRRVSRRRANSRSMTQSDSDFTPPSGSPRPKKKPQNIGDGRRLTLHARGIEAQIMDAIDRLEPEPFFSIPRLELLLSAASDAHGPTFNIQVTVRTILAQYSLYRHYAVGVAVMTLRKAFMQTGRDLSRRRHDSNPKDLSPPSSRLAPPGSPQDDGGSRSTNTPEMVTFDFKAALVQLKAEMPHDPAMMLHMYGLEMGRQRWSTPYIAAKLVRLYTEPPRMRNVWARVVSIKTGRLDFRESRRKSPQGAVIEEKMIDIVTEAVRIGIPHEVILSRISDNIINVIKAVQQLHHRFKTGTNEYILEKKPEGPKTVPKVSVRTRNFLFELEDGAFEWKLGMIYRTGLVEQVQRIAREEAFRVKLKRVREDEIRRGNSKMRSRSTFPRGRADAPSTSSVRSRSLDGMSGTNGHNGTHRGRVPRYDPESENFAVNGYSKVSEHAARYHLDVFNGQSWKKRIEKAYQLCQKNVKEARSQFWGPSQLPDDFEEAEHLLEVPPRPALMSTLINDLHFTLDKPTFPMKDLPDFVHKIGKGMPRDMQYSLLVPMHVGIEMGEAKVTLRDYPLPFLHIPPMKYGQSPKLQSVSLKSNFVIGEEFRGVESTRRVRVNVIPPRNASGEGSFAIEVRRTIGPVKSYSDVYMDVNTALPTRFTWGPCYQPAVQDMMMVIESFTKPQFDPSERVGFWDKLRLNFHSKIHAAWKGDGDVHLALKGTRDPYQVTGNGAGFLMCWRNDVKWNVNADDDPKRFIAVESSEYVLAIPDYSHEVREAARQQNELERHTPEDKFKSEATFKKVVMKLSGKVQFLLGLIFERAIEDGLRSFEFRPHYDIVLKNPHFAKDEDGLPYDAMRGFRSRHIHLSIAVRAPVDRDWLSENPEPSRSYNTVHLTPRFFTHFFAWWGLFGQPLSLPIRQGTLFPGREKNSKKFGRHLATVKYNLLLAPLFLSHIYKHKDVEDYSENAVSATGVKVRFDSFSLDLHQRREEFNTLGKGGNTETARTSGIKIHAAQLDLVSADIRAVSASLKGTTTEAIKKGSIATLMSDTEDKPDLSRFTIPDNDFSWIDMDDFVELDWILPTEPHPDTKILPLVYAPRLTYFRQTDIGGVIAGDPSRTSPFGNEPTHFCILNHDNDPIRVQGQLIQERLDQLGVQIQTHARNVGEAELKVIRSDGKDPELVQDFEALRKHTGVLREKKEFLESLLSQTEAKPSWSSQRMSGDRRRSVGSIGIHDETLHIPPSTEFESEFNNRFVIHNMQLKWNNLLRNIVLRYFHQNSQRRGFVYYLSRPAIKFILDIVEEQNKAKEAKANSKPKSTHTGRGGTSSKDPSINESDSAQDIEDRIKKIIGDGRKFTSATWSTNADSVMEGSIEDLVNGISEEFTPQSSYHIRIIAPQIQLQSDKNKKHVVLATAKGMELKVMEVMDKERISDDVSGLVQRRFLVNMDSIQFFVTHQKWFLTNLLSMYVGSKYGTPSGSSWPPWVPIEVVFDFQADPFGFKRVVQKTSAMIRYDKYNTLRLKYNDEVNTDAANEASTENAETRLDNLWVEFPQARALCNSSQYYALYVIVLDLLMYNEPLEKTRSERLEKIILASDFSDLSGAPAMVQKLQQRIRQMEEIKEHFQIYSKYLDKRGWEDRLRLERDLAACEDELFFMMKAITTSQRKLNVNSDSTALVRWNISVRDIVWHLMQDSNEALVEFQLKDLEYDRTDNSDGSHVNLIRVGKVLGLNLLPDATYPEMVAPHADPERTLGPESEKEMIRVYWYMLEAIAGITVMDRFEVNVLPIKVQLERDVGKRLFEYIFPGMDGDREKNDSPFILKQLGDGDEEDGDSLSSANGRSDSTSFEKDSSSFSTRPGSLELRLHPTLTSSSKSERSSKKALSVNTGEGHSFRLFRTPGTSRTLLKKASHESLRPGATPRALGRSSTGFESKDGRESIAGSEKRIPRFTLGKKQQADDKDKQASDDLTKMMTRASHFMTFASIKMPSVVLCLSYKGKDQRNFEDVHDFVFRMPTIEWQNKTWSNLDLALALKKAVMKALISHTGALIGNKFSKHRPNAEQRNKLRELANSSVLIAPSSSGGSQHYPGSLNDSDDSSSIYGSSPVDFSRSPPRSIRGSTHSSIPPSTTSRRRSRSSSVTSRTSRRNGGSGVHGPNVPTYLMMTPPTPIEDNRSFRHNQGMDLLRPGTSSGHSTAPTQNHQAFRRMATGIERPMTSMSNYEAGVRRKNGTNNLKDKLSALTYRMSHRDSSEQEDEPEAEEEMPPPTQQRTRRLSWVTGRSKG